MRTNRPYVQIDPDVLERVRQIDLLSYLREFEPSNLVTPMTGLWSVSAKIPMRSNSRAFQSHSRRSRSIGSKAH